jgi:hypothetical protein
MPKQSVAALRRSRTHEAATEEAESSLRGSAYSNKELLDELKTTLAAVRHEIANALASGKEYVPSKIGPELLIFDVRQPELPCEEWDKLTTREQLEASFYSFPDYLLRDRINIPPAYLHVHLPHLVPAPGKFREHVDELAARNIRGVARVFSDQKFNSPAYDLTELLTRWAHHEMNLPKLNPGEKVVDNVPVLLTDGSYLFLKLLKSDSQPHPYRAFTLQVKTVEFSLDVLMRIFEFLVGGLEGSN